MNKQQNGNTLDNVKCVVDSCCFNTCNGECTANAIEVKPRGVFGETGTDCATYIKREDSKGCSQ